MPGFIQKRQRTPETESFKQRTAFSLYKPIFKLSIYRYDHKTWPLAKPLEVAQITPFQPKGVGTELIYGYGFRDTGCYSTLGISLYGQQFLRYRPIFKIGTVRYETWPLAYKLVSCATERVVWLGHYIGSWWMSIEKYNRKINQEGVINMCLCYYKTTLNKYIQVTQLNYLQ